MVIGATCNCIQDISSTSINCQHYQLVDQTSIDASILAQTEYDNEYITSFFPEGSCSVLDAKIAGSGKK